MSSSPRVYALRLLKRRLMSAWEIDQALLRREVSAEDRNGVLEELVELGLLDDLRFAKAYVHDKDLFAPRSAWLLKTELKRKGVSEEIIAQVLQKDDREEAGNDDFALALALAERHSRRLAGLPKEAFQRRLSGVLARKGFSGGIIGRVLREAGASVGDMEE